MRLALALLLALMSPQLAFAETVRDRIERLARHWEIHLPKGDGPFPVVVQMHGCGGKKPFQTTWAKVAVEAGAAAIVVDSHAPRGISTFEAYASVCTALRLRGIERAGDLYAALAFARAQPWADRSRMIVAGWSHGGWTVSDALALAPGQPMRAATGLTDLPDEPLDGVAGAFLVYPFLGSLSFAPRVGWRVRPRTIAILGGLDVVVGRALPRAVLERFAKDGAPIEIVWFPTATHAFDEREAADLRVRYDETLTREAHGHYHRLIGELSARAPSSAP
jgi:dienelactone hydrolase